MNYMNKVAEMLGVEMGKNFKITERNDNFQLDGEGLISDTIGYSDCLLVSLLTGKRKIIKLPFTSIITRGDLYFYVNHEGEIDDEEFTYHEIDLARLYIGNMFRSYEEAESNIDNMLKVFKNVSENKINKRLET